MRTLVVTLSAVVALALPASSGAAVPCYQQGKEMPPASCALFNMAEYAHSTYFAPSLRSTWTASSPHGYFHSRWAFYPAYPGALRPLMLSAQRCRGHFRVFDHRQWAWNHAC